MLAHSFPVGAKVCVTICDWVRGGPTTQQVLGTIDSLVFAPFGYNVVLNLPHRFYSHIPIPYGTSYPLPDFSGTNIVLSKIFARPAAIKAFDDGGQKQLETRLKSFFSELVFSHITTLKPEHPNVKVLYYQYFHENNKLKTAVTDLSELPEDYDPQRLVTIQDFFYGFSKDVDDSSKHSYHFSSNRNSHIQFTKPCIWPIPAKPTPKAILKPAEKSLICGISSGQHGKGGNAEGLDKWFACSPQFKLLADLCTGKEVMTWEKALAGLVMPKDENNMPIFHEIPESRYLYAAIWSLASKGITKFPEDWCLPKRSSPRNPKMMLSFESWWPEHFCTAEL